MKPRLFFRRSLCAIPLGLSLFAGGCVTMETQEEVAQQQAQQQALQQTIDRLKAQTESMLAQQEQLQQQIQQLRSVPQDRVSTAEFQQLQSQTQSRIADLERKISALDAARAQDKQEIVNTLSKNMSTAMAQMNRAAPTPRSNGGTRSNSGASQSRPQNGAPQKAYEHIVAAGDTLSAIATAYRVSSGAIIAANSLADPGHPKVGQKLMIPAP